MISDRNYRTAGILTLVALVLATAARAEEQEAASPIGKKIEAFSLQDHRGKAWALDEFNDRKALVVAFLGVECPIAKLSGPKLAKLAEEFEKQGVGFLGIDANQQDSLAELAHYAKTTGIAFPLLKDAGNKIADRFGAERTPEVFLLDGERVVRYWGAIDDQLDYGKQRPAATQEPLRTALAEVLAGKAVTVASVPAKGCHIGRLLTADAKSEITYAKHIAPLLNARCVQCHRPGEIAPFALTSYEETVGWAEMIDEVVREERMPPWHASPAHGRFSNDARLSDADKSLIERWVAAGAPEGNQADLPPAPKFTEGWRIGTPDQVIYMRETPYKVKAEGEVRYQHFLVDPGFKEDKWIKAAEAKAGNRAVVHHIIVAVAPGSLASLDDAVQRSDWLTAMAPGSKPLQLPAGHAKFVPKGSKLVFQMHYTPNGTAQEDRSCVGFVFAKPEEVKHEVRTHKAAQQRFAIPPGAASHKVEATYTARVDETLLAMFPHMHLRGKSFRYTAIFPDGKQQILLDVPRYDFNWQNGYVLADPLKLPTGTKIHCVAHFDNSAENLANPDPKATVYWGDQTWEEMMIGYFDVALGEKAHVSTGGAAERTAKFIELNKAGKAALDADLKKLAADALSTEAAMIKFGQAIRRIAPQLDRACLTTIDGDQISIERCVQEPSVRGALVGAGVKVPADKKAITQIAGGKTTTVYPQLAARTEQDLEFMSKLYASSMHIPVKWNGKPATINFWSKEAEAFPAEAVKLLEEVAKAMLP